MKWRITGPARRDLDEIWSHTRSSWSVRQADRYIEALVTRIVWLTLNKNLWILRDDIRDDIRDGLFSYSEGRHLIVFKETSGKLAVLRVLHDRMDIRRQG